MELLEARSLGIWRLNDGGRLAVLGYGRVGRPAAEWVAGVVAGVLSGGGASYVELHVYESLALLEAVLAGEAERLGVAALAAFPVAFEAWTGVPRIHAALEGGIYGLTKIEAEALLGHEAMHSLLHSSPEYYTPPLTASSPLTAYAAAATVKDLEANIELERRGFRRLVYGLQAYWSREYPEGLPCTTPLDIFNTLRASTAWIAVKRKPPLKSECRGRLQHVMRLLERLAEEHRRGVRAWSAVELVAQKLAEENILS